MENTCLEMAKCVKQNKISVLSKIKLKVKTMERKEDVHFLLINAAKKK